MKRKLLLLIGSFILLLLAFGTYQLFVPGIAMFDPAGGMRLRPAALTFEPGKGPGIGRSEDVTFYYRNPDGQLRGVYHVAAWTKDDDGSFVLEQPEAVVYQRDGTRVYMTAERGRIWAEEVSGGKGFNVRNGTMDGQVEIFYDQSRDEDYGDEERPHPKDRPYDEMLRDVLRVTTTDVEFSRDLLELTTDGNVTIWSRQLDMTGQGLCLRWNEEPRELRLLRIEKGGVMVVKELPEEVNLTQLPTPQEQPSPTTQPETKPATAPATAPAGDWGLVEDRVAQSEPSPPPAVEEEPEATNVVVVMTQPRATTGPAQTQPTFGERKMMNIYQATFYTDVRLFSGDRRMTGAETLGMIFEWDRQWEGREDRPSPAKRPAASQPTTKPKFASARTQPGRRTLDAEAAQASDRQMVLYWDGSLEIVPQGRTETPSRDRVTITGQGEDVSLSDADARLLCKRFWFQNPQQEAWFEGDEKTPARVQLARGDEITCHGRIRFIRSLGKAFLEGPGEMVRYAREEDFAGHSYTSARLRTIPG